METNNNENESKFVLNPNNKNYFRSSNLPHRSYQNRNNYNNRNRFNNNKQQNFNKKNFSNDVNEKVIEKKIFDQNAFKTGIDFDNYERIPVEVSGTDVPPPIKDFAEIDNIHPQLLWNIKRSGYKKPTPVQKHSFSIAVGGRDIMGVAQTGSGKTAAFLLPMVQMLFEGSDSDDYVVRHNQHTPIGLILTPTRELANQIHKESIKFLYKTGMRSCAVYGGININIQRRALSFGVDILVATPGRLTDFLESGEIAMDNIRFLVMDEADRMLDMGFEDQIRKVLSKEFGMRSINGRQTMMFSATFPKDIQLLAQKFMKDYVFIAVGKVGGASESVKQELIYSESGEKQSILLDFFESIDGGSVLVFVQRKIFADRIERYLLKNGINAISIHGDKSQQDREYAIRSFKKGFKKVLVATDVASRGLDIPNVSYVVNYDMTLNIEDYIHRIGRTGRIGNKGIALTIITEQEQKKVLEGLRKVLKDSNQRVPSWMDELISRQQRDRPRNNRGRRWRGGRRTWRNDFERR